MPTYTEEVRFLAAVINDDPLDLRNALRFYAKARPFGYAFPLPSCDAAKLVGTTPEVINTRRTRGQATPGLKSITGFGWYHLSLHNVIQSLASGRFMMDDTAAKLVEAYPFHDLSQSELVDSYIGRIGNLFDSAQIGKTPEQYRKARAAFSAAYGEEVPDFTGTKEMLAWFAKHLPEPVVEDVDVAA